MAYSAYELIWIFFLCSFIGWGLETLNAAKKQRQFVNRGLVNGPFCVTYGIASVVNAIFLQELSAFWIFIGASLVAVLVEWIAGHILERFTTKKWWDYSGMLWNLDGYICFPMAILWGVIGTAGVLWGNDMILKLYHLIPKTIGKVFLIFLSIVLLLDVTATVIVISGKSRKIQTWKQIDSWFTLISVQLEDWLYRLSEKRIQRAYPKMQSVGMAEKQDCFAYGCSFYKICLLFVIGSLLGDITETIYCWIRTGIWMSRSSLVWGPFSIVWGFGIAAVTVLLYRYKERSDRFLFLMGTVLGGVYEYACSVITEVCFGMVFWDYSSMALNLGGRINLLYCFFWGFAAVIWFKGLYPVISSGIEKIPKRIGMAATRCLIVFMCCNMVVSSMALFRCMERNEGKPAEHSWQQVMDDRFPDERLSRIYPNMIRVG